MQGTVVRDGAEVSEGRKALQYNSQNRRSHGQGQTHGAEDILGEGKG